MPGDVEDAAASAIAFVTAGLVFIAAMGTLVYFANNKVPPASEERASVDYHAEARYLMETYVWANGGAPYVSDGLAPDPTVDTNTCTNPTTWLGTGDWDETTGLPPKLGFAGSFGLLDEEKVSTLREAAPASYPSSSLCTNPDGTYDYEQLRLAWNLTSPTSTVHLDFRISIVNTTTGYTLLDYGLDVPAGSATTPAVSHLPMRPVTGSADIPVRVTIHVFAR